MAKIRTGGIIDFRKHVCELLAIAQRQTDRHLHLVVSIEPAPWGKPLVILGTWPLRICGFAVLDADANETVGNAKSTVAIKQAQPLSRRRGSSLLNGFILL